MLLVAIIIGAILIVAALRNSQGTLFTALTTDIPSYVVWAAALVSVGAIGYIKPIKGVSDALIVLILTVLIVNNYKQILTGIEAVATPNAGVTPSTSSTATSAGSPLPSGSSASSPAGPSDGEIDDLIAAGG
jgi:hypothetical protein